MKQDRRTETTPERSVLTLRAAVDRWCANCETVALVFDVETGRARCRACGALD